jgi:ATP-dependent Clp protease adapter protein ClpS
VEPYFQNVHNMSIQWRRSCTFDPARHGIMYCLSKTNLWILANLVLCISFASISRRAEAFSPLNVQLSSNPTGSSGPVFVRTISRHKNDLLPLESAAAAVLHVQNKRLSTELSMSSLEKATTTKKGVQVLDRTETKTQEAKKKEQMWRVVLHNDEVHTFNYVVRSLCKVVGTLDRKAAFEICVETHGVGKATVTKTWKKQAENFCLNLQRQGLTVSISPDSDFEGGHSGGGI